MQILFLVYSSIKSASLSSGKVLSSLHDLAVKSNLVVVSGDTDLHGNEKYCGWQIVYLSTVRRLDD